MGLKLVLDRDNSSNSLWSLTSINASSTATLNGKKIVLDGDAVDPYYLKSDQYHTLKVGTIKATSSVTMNGIKLALHNDIIMTDGSPADNIIGTGL